MRRCLRRRPRRRRRSVTARPRAGTAATHQRGWRALARLPLRARGLGGLRLRAWFAHGLARDARGHPRDALAVAAHTGGRRCESPRSQWSRRGAGRPDAGAARRRRSSGAELRPTAVGRPRIPRRQCGGDGCGRPSSRLQLEAANDSILRRADDAVRGHSGCTRRWRRELLPARGGRRRQWRRPRSSTSLNCRSS